MSDLIERLERDLPDDAVGDYLVPVAMIREAIAALRAKDARFAEMVKLCAEETAQRLEERKGRFDAERRVTEQDAEIARLQHDIERQIGIASSYLKENMDTEARAEAAIAAAERRVKALKQLLRKAQESAFLPTDLDDAIDAAIRPTIIESAATCKTDTDG